MKQLFLIEIFIDKILIYGDPEAKNNKPRRLTLKVKFGPTAQFIIKEQQLVKTEARTSSVTSIGSDGQPPDWIRRFRVGKSYLFPEYPETFSLILQKYPLEFDVWDDDENGEDKIFVGHGSMQWDREFFYLLRESEDICKKLSPLSTKEKVKFSAECCCKECGEVTFILRLTPCGDSIVTEFQQLMNDPDKVLLRSDKAPPIFKCSTIEESKKSDLKIVDSDEKIVQVQLSPSNKVCTDQPEGPICPVEGPEPCGQEAKSKGTQKRYPFETIKMRDIKGPCGNKNCALANKVKNYIRSMDTYKQMAKLIPPGGPKGKTTSNICGKCVCKDDQWHREKCPGGIYDKVEEDKACAECGGLTRAGSTCEDRKKRVYGENTQTEPPKKVLPNSQVNVALIYSMINISSTKDSSENEIKILKTTSCQTLLRKRPVTKVVKEFIVLNVTDLPSPFKKKTNTQNPARGGCCCTSGACCGSRPPVAQLCPTSSTLAPTIRNNRTSMVYLSTESKSEGKNVTCIDPEDKECQCEPVKPAAPCKTFDCDCIMENEYSNKRKAHKPFCPVYKHKSACPVNMIITADEDKPPEEDDEVEPLPYGLPPVQLGPCPVMGRPCTVPDGFARMYKTHNLPNLPPSYSDAGKVCCSREFERIKKAIKEYLNYEKGHDFKCLNQFNVDTEKRCCDNEQKRFPLTGKSCCGMHKLLIQEKYKQEK